MAAWLWSMPVSSQAADKRGAQKIGYVDMQRLLEAAPQVNAARDRLTQEFKQRDEALLKDRQHLADLKARLASMSAADDGAPQLRQQIQTLERSIERTQSRLREELYKRSDEEYERAWPLIRQAVSRYARSQGYDVILPSPVVYVSAEVDVTDDVIQQLKQTARAGKGDSQASSP